MKVSIIICAAGRGIRAGLGKNKVLYPLHGAPVLYHTLEKFNSIEHYECLVTCSQDDYDEVSALCAPFHARAVLGGETRTESVRNALKEVSGDIVLIHDGARPFVTPKTIQDCIEGVMQYGSAVCAVPVTDTTVQATGEGVLSAVLPRSTLYAVQTPQGFLTKDIKKAYDLAKDEGESFTDDSSVYSRYIAPAHLCAGDSANKKLTYKEDFESDFPPLMPLSSREGKIGLGIDVHSFGANKDYVILCGEKIACDSGLVAHSDGDVAVHALMDALLSAAGLLDIGHYFPDTDEKWKGACSMTMLKEVVRLLNENGYNPRAVSITIQAEKPRLSRHIAEMKENLSKVLAIPQGDIAIAAGTCEHLGFVGKGLGIAAYCLCKIE
jgi:2-C-methyl-D-erythritol 4-phosphate cytidylyltransferase/2-C-methyl-D-erythritol 2,4-cyclodiphosphate synthase